MNIQEVKQKITPILQRHNVLTASVFGSIARGEANETSDVDLVVKVGKLPFDIWGFVALRNDLEQALQKKLTLYRNPP